jgi:peptidoglycan/xylan/chitin deacetylase (PgdA/CDA1 family)
LPILSAHNVAATFFVSVDFVDRGESFWFDRVAAAARAWSTNPAAQKATNGLPTLLVNAFESPGSLAERARAAAAFLKTLPDDERRHWVEALEPLARGGASGDAPMQWDEVRALHRAGMSIGAHGMRHGILTRMPGDDAAREIGASVALIGQRVGAPVESFAYPNGDVDDAVADLARRAGVRLGFTMAGRNVGPGIDALRIARRNVCEDTSRGRDGRFSAAYFWCEITGVFDVLAGRLLRRG